MLNEHLFLVIIMCFFSYTCRRVERGEFTKRNKAGEAFVQTGRCHGIKEMSPIVKRPGFDPLLHFPIDCFHNIGKYSWLVYSEVVMAKVDIFCRRGNSQNDVAMSMPQCDRIINKETGNQKGCV